MSSNTFTALHRIGFLATLVASAVVLACYKEPDAPPIPELLLLTGTDSTPLLTWPNCSDAGDFRANGTDERVLEIKTKGGADDDTPSYEIKVASADGLLDVLPFGNSAAAPMDGGSDASSTESHGGTISVTHPTQTDHVRLRAGRTKGDAQLLVGRGGTTTSYCIMLAAAPAATLSIQVATSSSPAPTGWTSYDVRATVLSAEGQHVSDEMTLVWTSYDCAYFAANTTRTRAMDTVTNTLFVPPGFNAAKIDVRVGTDAAAATDSGLATSLCVTPAGAAGLFDGGCPKVERKGDAGDAPSLVLTCTSP